MDKNIVAVIPARGGSKGVPRKNIMNFCGKPLLVWSIEQAKNTPHVTHVVVSSDDDEILTIAQEAGAMPIKRPDAIASDEADLEGVFNHVISEMNAQGHTVDVMVCLQPTSPLKQSDDIGKAVTQFLNEGLDSLFSASRWEEACLWGEKDGEWQSVTYDYRNRGRRQDRSPLFLENGAIYIFKPKTLTHYKNRLGGKIGVYVMPFWTSFEIDEHEDIAICEWYMRRNILKSR